MDAAIELLAFLARLVAQCTLLAHRHQLDRGLGDAEVDEKLLDRFRAPLSEDPVVLGRSLAVGIALDEHHPGVGQIHEPRRLLEHAGGVGTQTRALEVEVDVGVEDAGRWRRHHGAGACRLPGLLPRDVSTQKGQGNDRHAAADERARWGDGTGDPRRDSPGGGRRSSRDVLGSHARGGGGARDERRHGEAGRGAATPPRGDAGATGRRPPRRRLLRRQEHASACRRRPRAPGDDGVHGSDQRLGGARPGLCRPPGTGRVQPGPRSAARGSGQAVSHRPRRPPDRDQAGDDGPGGCTVRRAWQGMPGAQSPRPSRVPQAGRRRPGTADGGRAERRRSGTGRPDVSRRRALIMSMSRAPGHFAPLVILISVLAATAARAEGAGGDTPQPGRVTEGALFWRAAQREALVPAPVLKTDVHLVVTGIVARASVRQEFTNPGSEWAEGIYVFPLPEDAAVDHLRMQIGDRLIEGVIEERAVAKARYEGAKQAGKRASLLERERPNIFTTSVANIPPGAAVAVEIVYQQTIRYDAGQFRLRFPMVVGPRYIPGTTEPRASVGSGWARDTGQVPDASRITPPVEHPARGALNPVSLLIELDPGIPLARVAASYHEIQTTPLAGGRYRIELTQGSVPADRDFELVWQPAAAATPTATLLTENKRGEVFALLMVMPPAPPALDGLRRPREVVFVIDNSGSMHGASIDQAKAALRLALGRLRPTDTFNVIRFNHTMDALFPQAQPATSPNLNAADRYAPRLRADGGTEMLPALLQALDGHEHPGRLRQVIFLTDGAVGNEARLLSTIHERLGDSRLFTIGIGSAPNGHFMRDAARLGRGTFTYIGSTTEVKE